MDVNDSYPVDLKKTLAGKMAATYAQLMTVDIRRISIAIREVAKALYADCIDILGLREDRLNVEFTQHSGDEMYHPTLGGFSPEWSANEV